MQKPQIVQNKVIYDVALLELLTNPYWCYHIKHLNGLV